METRVSSATREVIIGDQQPTVLIGERINPAGKKKLLQALRTRNLETIRDEALAQVQAGADILDINVSLVGIDEAALLPEVVRMVMASVEVPLCLDSTNPEALAAALSVYRGKPVINSITGEEHSLATILPLVKEYGTAVIGLVQDDEGIPNSVERRVAIAHKIVSRAEAAGIPREDIIIDVEAFAIGADPASGLKVIESIRRIKAEMGVNLTLAVSNVSFGLPDRPLLNNAFAAAAMAAGVTCLLADAGKVRPTVLAADLILGRDKRARRYLEAYRQHQNQPSS